MTREKILNCVELADLQPELQPLAERIGIDAVRIMLEELEGIRVDIKVYSRSRSVVRRYIQRYYRKNADGSDNVIELARSLSLRPQRVREYLRQGDS